MKKTVTPQELLSLLSRGMIRTSNISFFAGGQSVDIDQVSFDVDTLSKSVTKDMISDTEVSVCELLMRKVTSFDLPISVQNFLERDNVLYVWQLVILSDKALLHVDRIGKVSLISIRESIKKIPGFKNGDIISCLRQRVFTRMFCLRISEIKRPNKELDLVRSLAERTDEVERLMKEIFS